MIIFCLFYDQKDYKNRIVFMISGLLYGPFPMLGILLYFITFDITESIQKKEFTLLKYLSIQNILSIFLLFPIFLFYYLTNAAISNNEFPLLNNSISPFFRTRYILFVLLEFLCYIVLIFQHKNLKSIIIITIYLLAIPFVNHADFVM